MLGAGFPGPVPSDAVGAVFRFAGAANGPVGAVLQTPEMADEAITKEPPLGNQSGTLAYTKGVLVGAYDSGKGAVEGIAQLPHTITHLREFAENVQDLLKEVKRGLSEQDIGALKNTDPDLYRLLEPTEYRQLTDWWEGRLTSRIVLKYAALAQGGYSLGKLGTQFSKAAARGAKQMGGQLAARIKGRLAAKGLLERARVKSVWELGPAARGEAIEKILGKNTPGNFDTFDRVENGVATSIKSVNLADKTYAADSGFRSLRNYIDAIENFDQAQRALVLRSKLLKSNKNACRSPYQEDRQPPLK
jgi:hypothetical protein